MIATRAKMSEALGILVTVTPTELLAFESRWPGHTPAKGAAIRGLGMHEARYYQQLSRAAHSPEGIAADPITARRVRDWKSSRREHILSTPRALGPAA